MLNRARSAAAALGRLVLSDTAKPTMRLFSLTSPDIQLDYAQESTQFYQPVWQSPRKIDFGMFQNVQLSYQLSQMFGFTEPSFASSVRIALEKSLPTTRMSLYSYSKNGTDYYYSFKKETFIKDEINFCCMGEYIADDFAEGFRIFAQEVGIFEQPRYMLFITEQPFMETLGPILDEYGFDFSSDYIYGYIMTEQQQDLLMKQPPLQLPAGYTLGSSTLDDVETMVSNYPHRDKEIELEIEQTKMKIRAFPSSMIRFNGKPAAWEYVYMDGQLNNLHVLKEHRDKGLGHIIQRDLVKKLIRQNRYIFKCVLMKNEKFSLASDRSPFWTRHILPDGRLWRPDDVHVFPKGQAKGQIEH